MIERVRDERAAFPVAFYYAFEAYNPHRTWSHFCGISSFMKNTCATLRAQVARASNFQRLFFTNHKFENLTFVWVRLIFFFSVSSISFDCRTQSNSVNELSSIGFDWNLISSIGYAIAAWLSTDLKTRKFRKFAYRLWGTYWSHLDCTWWVNACVDYLSVSGCRCTFIDLYVNVSRSIPSRPRH